MLSKAASAKVTSPGVADSNLLPRGTPWPSTTTIHFVPLPFLVFPTQAPLFFAGAKLPSRNDSLQSRRPFWSNSARNCRQILSHVPSSSHRRRRRQHVLGLGYLSGRSFQRAPVRSIQRMPSSTSRSSAHGRPWLARSGSNGSILAHCLSERNTSRIRSFSPIPPKKAPEKSKNRAPGIYETASSMIDLHGQLASLPCRVMKIVSTFGFENLPTVAG